MKKTVRKPVGRPSGYRKEFAKRVCEYAELGATDADICRFLDISTKTLWDWRIAHPEFLSAQKTGKAVADDRVEKSLYHRAIGYSHEAVKIFANPKTGENVKVDYIERYPPDTTACIFWLKNRKQAEWRERSASESEDLTPDQIAGQAPPPDVSRADEPGPASPRL